MKKLGWKENKSLERGGRARTRMIWLTLDPNVITAKIVVGKFTGKIAFIHTIKLTPSADEHSGIPFERTQFPIRLCFAMTINKAQGQTLYFVSLYLCELVFLHWTTICGII